MRRSKAMAAIVAAMIVIGFNCPLPAASRNAPTEIALAGDGLVIGKSKLAFRATATARAIAAVSTVLGTPLKQGSYGDCGQGDTIRYAKFRNGFELSFVHGKLVGWTADRPGPKTIKGVAVGASLTALRKAYPDIETDPGDEAHGGLGPSFQREGGPNGWLSGTKPTARVTGLYAGATCIAT